MRGKANLLIVNANGARITPAYAGKSESYRGCTHRSGDHPRLCGEKTNCTVQIPLVGGSPPPMRGKARFGIAVLSLRRITPAYAGKSRTNAGDFFDTQDHPRLCGEKLCVRCFGQILKGSPPPMRGKVLQLRQLFLCIRITPAYAGKSKTIAGEAFKGEDHPRLCGEKGNITTKNTLTTGSPPPMRGKEIPFWGYDL